jgi:tRNA G18 (ribose-2'-O)-methylase SpoU
MEREVIVVLDNVRSAHNVGSVFRTSDGAGVSRIILGGYTPAPIDRFGRAQPEIAKTSLGATKTIPWEHCGEEALLTRLAQYRDEGFALVAAEQHPNSVSLHDFTSYRSCTLCRFFCSIPFLKKILQSLALCPRHNSPPAKVCYIFGNEIDGVRPELLTVADTILEIPLHGHKESLNVAVAAGIVLFQT